MTTGLDNNKDPKKVVQWKRGSNQKVAWTAVQNHEGGYSYS